MDYYEAQADMEKSHSKYERAAAKIMDHLSDLRGIRQELDQWLDEDRIALLMDISNIIKQETYLTP